MNKHIFYNLFWIAGLAWLLSGCAGAPITLTPTAMLVLSSATPVPPTTTAVPTTTPTPTLTPTTIPSPMDPKLLSDLEEMIKNEGEASSEMIDSIIERIQKNPSGVAKSILPKLKDKKQGEADLAVYAWALGWTGQQSVIDPLYELARESDSDWVEANCIQSLINIGGERAGEKLSSLFDVTMNQDQRYSTLNGLAGMQYEPALPLMGTVLEVDPIQEYWKPIFIFGKMGDLGVPYLLEKLEDDDFNVRANAILLLGKKMLVPEAAQPLREHYWTEEDPRLRNLILSSLELISDDLESVQKFSEEVIAKEKDESLVQFAQETINSLPDLRKGIDSFISEKKVSIQDFQKEYDALYESVGHNGDTEILARASTPADEAQLKKLRERILQRDSDEALIDYDKVTWIIMMNRLAQGVSEQEGKSWETWTTASPETNTPTP